jgi:N-acetylglucosaminyldiphosphoundecaprenol N-acetyl-beta-D-mannosaminyltransferase
MTTPKITLFNIEIDALTMEQSVNLINKSILEKNQVVHNCINANKVVLMEKDKFLQQTLKDADIISADGQAIVWASQLMGNPLPERVPGIDLMENLMQMANKNGYKAFLFGAKEEIVKMVSNHYNKVFEGSIVAGYRNGYFSKNEEVKIVEQINNSGAQMLFVAIPSPQKEYFINKYRKKLPNILLLMGVGGSFDVVSGTVTRAPRWMQDKGLEWLFRLIQEPSKMWKRYLFGNLSYIRITIKEYFSNK